MKYYFKNILGNFALDRNFSLMEEVSRQDNLESVPKEKLPQALWLFKNKRFYPQFYQKNLELTKIAIRNSVSPDQLISNTIASITEVDKSANLFSKRLREWYSWHFPELAEKVASQDRYAELVLNKSRQELQRELNLKESLGADFSPSDLEEMKLVAEEVLRLLELRKKHEAYLEEVMKKYCPNLQDLAGTTIGAKLLELGKSLRHLAMLPSSTIQLLGAEKALFRHLKTGSRSPKFGVIHDHPLVQNAGKDKGKAARMLADKLSLCARLDYFRGEFKAPEYRKELEEKLK